MYNDKDHGGALLSKEVKYIYEEGRGGPWHRGRGVGWEEKVRKEMKRRGNGKEVRRRSENIYAFGITAIIELMQALMICHCSLQIWFFPLLPGPPSALIFHSSLLINYLLFIYFFCFLQKCPPPLISPLELVSQW